MQVSIDRCTFRGTEAAIAHARESLEKSRFPAISDAEYVIIRQLSVKAESTHLEHSYLRQTEALLASKVNGWSEDADRADCVWFASETDLYACLCRDIASGRVDSLWYWKQFAHLDAGFTSQTLVRIFRQQAAHLPALIHQLAETGTLLPVWMQISSVDKHSFLKDAIPEKLRHSIETAVEEIDVLATGQGSDGKLPALLEMLISTISPGSQVLIQEVELAIALFLLTSRPHQALSAEREPLIRELIAVEAISVLLEIASIHHSPDAFPDRASSTGTDSRDGTGTISSTEKPAMPPLTTGKVMQDSVDQGDSHDRKQLDDVTDIQVGNRDRLFHDEFISDDGDATFPPADSGQAGSESPAADQWYLEQGGLFYLLNLLNQPVICDRLLTDRQAVAFPSGWGWLYRLGECFGLQYERELVRCLARLSGMEEKRFLAQTPGLDAASEILAYAEQRYGTFGFWSDSLLQKPVHVAFLRPEVTISYSMEAIDIELRKSGLDIDPGWVDWLGAMIRFRYREFP